MKVNYGDKFGELTFIKEVPSLIAGHRSYQCQCSCGAIITVTRNNLLKGNSTRCFRCAIVIRSQKQMKYDTKKNKLTYSSYRCMLDRCANHARYIKVQICDRWLDEESGFLNFLADMGERPADCTLDRIDNSLGYFKDNCRWSTYSVQNHNKGKRTGYTSSSLIGVTLDKTTWVVQFYFQGSKTTIRCKSEIEAAICYDNLSEDHYGDRPNKTERIQIEPKIRKAGGVSKDSRTGRYRARITADGKRTTIGFYDTQEEAEQAVSEFKN